jgi:O-antigen/teichoic acid export membrane protein
MSKKYNFKKAIWYSVENLTAIIFGLLSVVLVARLFGPESLGKLSLVQATSAMAMFMVVLGLDHIVVIDLARKPKDFQFMSTVFITQLIGWCFYMASVFLVLLFINELHIPSDILIIFIAVICATYFNRATVIKYYFQAINQPRTIAISALISRLCSLVYLLIALMLDFNYEFVLLFLPIQALIQFLILSITFFKSLDGGFKFQYSYTRSKHILGEALPLIGAAVLFPIFMQADILLISALLSELDVGIYSAATRLISQFVFLGHIITMTFYLALTKRIDKDSADKELFISGLIKILFCFGFIMSFITFVLSDFIISILYGEKFLGAGDVLAIVAWNWCIIFPAALYSRLLVIWGLAKYEFIKSLVVATLSLSLNFMLIPKFGIIGAAFVSLCSYFIADFLIYACFSKTRYLFLLSFKSIYELVIHPKKSYSTIIYTLSCK